MQASSFSDSLDDDDELLALFNPPFSSVFQSTDYCQSQLSYSCLTDLKLMLGIPSQAQVSCFLTSTLLTSKIKAVLFLIDSIICFSSSWRLQNLFTQFLLPTKVSLLAMERALSTIYRFFTSRRFFNYSNTHQHSYYQALPLMTGDLPNLVLGLARIFSVSDSEVVVSLAVVVAFVVGSSQNLFYLLIVSSLRFLRLFILSCLSFCTRYLYFLSSSRLQSQKYFSFLLSPNCEPSSKGLSILTSTSWYFLILKHNPLHEQIYSSLPNNQVRHQSTCLIICTSCF